MANGLFTVMFRDIVKELVEEMMDDLANQKDAEEPGQTKEPEDSGQPKEPKEPEEPGQPKEPEENMNTAKIIDLKKEMMQFLAQNRMSSPADNTELSPEKALAEIVGLVKEG